MRIGMFVVAVACFGSAASGESALKQVKDRGFANGVELLVADKDDVLALTPDAVKKDTLTLVSLADGGVRREFHHPKAAVGADAKGRILAFGAEDGTLTVYDLAGKGEPKTYSAKGGIRSVAVSADGALIAASLTDNKTIELWDVAKGTSQAAPLNEMKSGRMAVGKGGLVASCRFEAPRIRVYDGAKGEVTTDLEPAGEPIGQMEFSEDGKQLLTVGIAGVVRLWDVGAKKTVLELVTLGNSFSIFSASLSPDGSYLVVSDLKGSVGIVNVGTGQFTTRTDAYPEMQPARIVRFLNNSRFATCSVPGYKTILWEYTPPK